MQTTDTCFLPNGQILVELKSTLLMRTLLCCNKPMMFATFDIYFIDWKKIIIISKIQLVVYYQCCILVDWATTRLCVIAH